MLRYIFLLACFALVACGRILLPNDDVPPAVTGDSTDPFDASRPGVDDAVAPAEAVDPGDASTRMDGAQTGDANGDDAIADAQRGDSALNLDWSTVAPCLDAGDKLFYVAGSDGGATRLDARERWWPLIYPTNVRVEVGDWSVTMQNQTEYISTPGTYYGTSETRADPLFAVSYNGKVCDGGVGRGSYTIFEAQFSRVVFRPQSVTASFVQTCDGSGESLHGCVHYVGDGN